MSQIAIPLGLLLGLALGIAASVTGDPSLIAFAEGVAPFGDAFMRAIQMVVIPLVGVTVFVGVAKISDSRKLGRLGGLSVGFFWLTTLPAILIGMGVMKLALTFAPEVMPPTPTDSIVSELPGIVNFLINLIPRNPFEAAAAGSLLPIIVFTVLFAAATAKLPAEKSAPLLSLAEAASDVLIKLVYWVLWTAPLGVFGLAAPVVARTGIAMLQNLGIFILAVVVGLFVFMVVVFLPAVRFFGGMSPVRFLKGVVGSYMMGFSTTSSVASLPITIKEARQLEISPEVSTLVLPLAAAINRPGSALFQGAAVIFMASVYGISVGPAAIVGAVLATFLAAMTVAPVPSASIVAMVPAFNAVGIPLPALGMLLGIDRVPDMFRSGVNVMGHVAAATTVHGLSNGDAEGSVR